MSRPTQAAIDAWIAKNGGARRFERGASNDFLSIGAYLERHGVEVKFSKTGFYTVKEPAGTARTVTLDGVFGVVDALRVAEGLQPFMVEHVAP